jgi:hypothetical protein
MSKNLWCDETEPRKTPKVVEITPAQSSLNSKIDYTFNSMVTGDKIKYGSITLTATDSRPQSAHFVENQAGTPDQLIRLECPGYIELDVEKNGEKIDHLSYNYAAKFLGSGGLLDGWPSFTLGEVLGDAGVSNNERQKILDDYDRDVRQRWDVAYKQAADEIVKKNRKNNFSQACQNTFRLQQNSGWDKPFEYTVRPKDNATTIAAAFNKCNEGGGFFPLQYAPVERFSIFTERGENAANAEPSGRYIHGRRRDIYYQQTVTLRPRDKVRIVTRENRDLAVPSNEDVRKIFDRQAKNKNTDN